MVGYFRNCDILKIGCFWQNPKIHENWRFENWLFWPFSISNLCHRQTIRDRSMKPIANNSLGSQFLQEKSPMWKYQPIFERTPWPNLAVQNSKFAVHDCPGWRCLCHWISQQDMRFHKLTHRGWFYWCGILTDTCRNSSKPLWNRNWMNTTASVVAQIQVICVV